MEHDSLPGTHTVQCLQDAVQKPDWSSKVSAAAGCFGTLAVLAVSAAYGDTMQPAPIASQVAPIKVEVSDKTLLELKIDPNRYEQFSKLGTYQGGVLLFLDGLKKASNLPAGNPNKLTVDLDSVVTSGIQSCHNSVPATIGHRDEPSSLEKTRPE